MSRVRTQAEYGMDGYRALVERYGVTQVNRWRRLGGRRRNRTLAEIRADARDGRAMPGTNTGRGASTHPARHS